MLSQSLGIFKEGPDSYLLTFAEINSENEQTNAKKEEENIENDKRKQVTIINTGEDDLDIEEPGYFKSNVIPNKAKSAKHSEVWENNEKGRSIIDALGERNRKEKIGNIKNDIFGNAERKSNRNFTPHLESRQRQLLNDIDDLQNVVLPIRNGEKPFINGHRNVDKHYFKTEDSLLFGLNNLTNDIYKGEHHLNNGRGRLRAKYIRHYDKSGRNVCDKKCRRKQKQAFRRKLMFDRLGGGNREDWAHRASRNGFDNLKMKNQRYHDGKVLRESPEENFSHSLELRTDSEQPTSHTSRKRRDDNEVSY